MKLIYCNSCKDVIRIYKTTETCLCGDSGGHYKEDGFNVVIYGPCKPIGFKNDEFSSALENQPKFGNGREFTSYVIPINCPTVEHVDSKDYEGITSEAYYKKFEIEFNPKTGSSNANYVREQLDKKKKIKNVFKDEK
jgi:hypothetical protein